MDCQLDEFSLGRVMVI